MFKGISFDNINGTSLKIGVVKACWNKQITGALFEGCMRALNESGVKKKNIVTLEVPGSFELAFGAMQLIRTKKPDAVICIGVLIKGDTRHDEYLAQAASHGIMQVGLETDIPVVFGVLTCQTEAQALARATGENNHGYFWGKSALSMGLINKK